MNQRFEADCCKICAHLLKDDQKQNQLSLCKGQQEQAKKKRDFHSKSEQEMKAGFMAMTQKQSNIIPVEESSTCHPRELRQMKSDFKSMSVFVNSEVILQSQPVNQQFSLGVPRVFMEDVGRKCPTSGVHRTGFCIMTTRHGTQIHSFFRCLTKREREREKGGGIWPVYFSSLVFMAYSSSQR